MTPTNYIETENPFNLASPPAWFLARLYAYDPRIVIFPSRCRPVYQVGERGRFGRGLVKPVDHLPDTKIFAAHHLWPWKAILPPGVAGFSWARILDQLPRYDTQRYDDPAGQLDRVEAEQEAATDRAMLDELDAINSDAYRAIKVMEGSRVGFGSRPAGTFGQWEDPRKEAARRARRRPRAQAHRPRGAGTGAIWSGR